MVPVLAVTRIGGQTFVDVATEFNGSTVAKQRSVTLGDTVGNDYAITLVDFFIQRPIFATVYALLIILAGAVCIPTLPISLYPNLAPPQVTVTSNYVGANAQVVESAVTIPLEQQINGVEGMHYITVRDPEDLAGEVVGHKTKAGRLDHRRACSVMKRPFVSR